MVAIFVILLILSLVAIDAFIYRRRRRRATRLSLLVPEPTAGEWLESGSEVAGPR